MPLPLSGSAGEATQFSQQLLDWFALAKRPLPWRKDYGSYAVWISEIMLQQTQMERGVRYFLEWMQRFPTIASVASADEDAILAAWEGLGYYSRARNLHAAARMIVTHYGGEFPTSLEEIRTLPGVGQYTAAAIASIAFNIPEPAVDANVLRIFSRILDIDQFVSSRDVFVLVESTVRALMPAQSPRLFNQALMELGALVCGKQPRCESCPVTGFCLARERGTVSERPVKKAPQERVVREAAAAIIFDDATRATFIRKRPDSGLWAGLWEFPHCEVVQGGDPEKELLARVNDETGMIVSVDEKVGVVRHGYTTNHVTLCGYLCRLEQGAEKENQVREKTGKWVCVDDLEKYSFSAGHRKLLERLGWKKHAAFSKQGRSSKAVQ